jgi:hypothetical protein
MIKIQFSQAAQENIDETGSDVEADLAALRSGENTPESLLAHCLNQADEDREQGWREYVAALAAATTVELHLIASAPSHSDRHMNPDATARLLGTYPNAFEARSAGRAYLRQHDGAWLQIQGEQIEDVTL